MPMLFGGRCGSILEQSRLGLAGNPSILSVFCRSGGLLFQRLRETVPRRRLQQGSHRRDLDSNTDEVLIDGEFTFGHLEGFVVPS